MKFSQDFEGWYANLKELADKHGESVADRDAWREEFELNKSAMQAFYEEYPEHKPNETDTRL
jgi:hypothetical protein